MCDHAELFAFADSLKGEKGAARRASISRAYYAAFHALQDGIDPMLDESDRGPLGTATHGAVLRCLRTWGQKHPDRKKAMAFGAEAMQCYNRLSSCKEERELADYLMGSHNDPTFEVARDVIGKAERVIKFAAKL
jgi:hypothetical protein